MNSEYANKLLASVQRQQYLIKLLHFEYEYFSKTMNGDSKIKQTLLFNKNLYANAVNRVIAVLPHTGLALQNDVEADEDKLRAIGVMIEKMFMLPVETVMQLEADFENVKVVYGEDSVTQVENKAA